jgi:uncharacterized protein
MNNRYPFDSELLIKICRENGVKEIRLFGSMARGDYSVKSDVDLLVTFAFPISLLQMAHLKAELSETMGWEIDLVTEAGLSPYIYEHVMQEAILLYQG